MNVENLPVSLKIQNELLIICLNSIKEAIKKIWDRPLLDNYTNHGLDHSQRIIEILGYLLEDYPSLLNEHERFILLAAAYLHDIGMQSPKHAGLPDKSKYTIKELEKVRENHHLTSAKMINEYITGKPTVSLGFEQCKDYGDFLATLSKYHRKLDINEVKDTSLAGEELKLQLLTALLRFSDALDADYRRVNMEVLKLRKIPVESKYHWWFHCYVQSIFIKKGHIKLYFRFPKEYRRDDLIEVFINRVKQSLSNALLEVYNLLDKYGIRLFPDVEIEKERYAAGLELIPDDLSEYIKENVLRTKELSQEKSTQTGVVWFVNGAPYSDNPAVVECLAKVFKFIDEGRNFDAAKEIERGRVLIMGPKEKMIFSIISGNCHYILGNLTKAEEYYQDVLKISERKDLQVIYKNDVVLAKSAALGNIGLIYRDKVELDQALQYLEDALKIDREIGYKQGEASGLGNIGLIYRDKGELDQALQYLEDALKIDREIGYKKGEANDLGNIGLIYSDKGVLDQALQYLEDALKIHREIGYKQGEASDLGNIGLIFSDKGELDEAIKYLQAALNIFTIVSPPLRIQTLNNIAEVYFKKQSYDKGFEYLAKAMTLSTSAEQFNSVFSLLLITIREMIENNDWGNLEKIHSTYASGIISEDMCINFFTAIHEYAKYKKTGDESYQHNYKAARQKLNPEFNKLLDGLLKIKKS